MRIAEVEPGQSFRDDDRVRPSAVKYRLYGSSTGIGAPGSPVWGSIGVNVFPRSAATHRVFRS